MKKSQLSISLYLANEYYMAIVTIETNSLLRDDAISWVTPNLDFKDTLLFDVDYIRNSPLSDGCNKLRKQVAATISRCIYRHSHIKPFNGQTKTAEQRIIIQKFGDWYTGRWWVGCYIWYSEEGPGRAAAPPSPLIAVPNVTAHPSTASVPTSYHWTCHYSYLCPLKGEITGSTSNVLTFYTLAGYVFLLCPVVPISIPLSRVNMDSSAGRASPLHTCSSGGIIWPRAVLSRLVCPMLCIFGLNLNMHGQNINLPVCVCLCVSVSVTLFVNSPTGQTPQRIFTVDNLRKDVPFGGLDDE